MDALGYFLGILFYIEINDAFTEPNTWGTIEVSHSFQSFETGGVFLIELTEYIHSNHLDRAERREVSIIIFGIGFCGCIGISYGDFMGIGF